MLLHLGNVITIWHVQVYVCIPFCIPHKHTAPSQEAPDTNLRIAKTGPNTHNQMLVINTLKPLNESEHKSPKTTLTSFQEFHAFLPFYLFYPHVQGISPIVSWARACAWTIKEPHLPYETGLDITQSHACISLRYTHMHLQYCISSTRHHGYFFLFFAPHFSVATIQRRLLFWGATVRGGRSFLWKACIWAIHHRLLVAGSSSHSLVPRHPIFCARPAALLKNRVWTLSLQKLGHVYTWRLVNWSNCRC